MAYTQLDIVNSALIKVGEKPIHSLDDDSNQARLAKLRFAVVADLVTTLHPFSCAKSRRKLNPEVDEPPFGFRYQFPLPDELLRLLAVVGPAGDTLYDFVVEGHKVLANVDRIGISFVRSLVNELRFDHDVGELVSLYLAYDICERIDGGNPQKQGQLFEAFNRFLAHVRTVDARRNGPRSYGPNNTFDIESLYDRPIGLEDYRRL